MSDSQYFWVLLTVLILPITLSAMSIAFDLGMVAKQVLKWLEKEDNRRNQP